MDSRLSQGKEGRINLWIQHLWEQPEYTDQFRRLFPFLLKLYLPVALLLGIVAWAGLRYGINLGDFMRDPATVATFPPYVGLVSNLGILLWTVPAAISLFCAILLKHRRDAFHFYVAAGLFTTLVMLDDFFLFHEVVFPKYLYIPEQAVEVFYLVLLLVFLLRFSFYILRRTEYLILFVAIGFLGASALWDMVMPSIPGYYFYEDGLKFCGIVAWAAYFTRTGLQMLRREINLLRPRLPAD